VHGLAQAGAHGKEKVPVGTQEIGKLLSVELGLVAALERRDGRYGAVFTAMLFRNDPGLDNEVYTFTRYDIETGYRDEVADSPVKVTGTDVRDVCARVFGEKITEGSFNAFVHFNRI
jgi:hypothetical protein